MTLPPAIGASVFGYLICAVRSLVFGIGIRVESITKRRQTQIISAYFRTLIDNFFCLRETERECEGEGATEIMN